MSTLETLEFVVSHLVDNPDDVRIETETSGRTTVFNLYVHPDDIGKIIGRGGRTARAIRTVVKTAAVREDRNAIVEIID